ncbi:MAG: AGE family epimerase/isomerase [Caulobacteraceae bacterium]|nr:AGE family epimerase/isomerase [Caulobacteraceae bacterium]
MAIHPVILCGGSGTRLWPASNEAHPKQFVPLLGERSMFQDTILRMGQLKDAGRPMVVAGHAYLDLVRRQLAELGQDALILVEPIGRDTAPAIAAAALQVLRDDPEGVVVIAPSDHSIPDWEAFSAAVDLARPVAAGGYLVTLGVQPSFPSTAFGYINPGAQALAEGVRQVEAFVEKPSAEIAQSYVDRGYLWNSGTFIFSAAALTADLHRHAPDVIAAVTKALDEGGLSDSVRVLGEAFRTAPKISIDYALVEKSDKVGVVPVGFSWSDLGAWDAVHTASVKDGAGNAASADVILIDCENVLVRAPDHTTVAAIGLANIAVVVEGRDILVCALGASQSVKDAVVKVADLRARRSAAPVSDAARESSLGAGARSLDLWMRTAAYPLWASLGADPVNGGFNETLELDGRPSRDPRRLRVQARQIFAFATAAATGWDGDARRIVAGGLNAMINGYQRPDGAFRTLVSADGAPLNETAFLYDHAFVLLALSSAYRIGVEAPRAQALAEALVSGPLAAMRHGAGGFIEASAEQPFQSNPHMHLLEAALAWEAETGAAVWCDLADEIVRLALNAFIDAPLGAIREFFNPDWTPATGEPGRILEPGHQFEWAWLLERWGRLRDRKDARQAAARLFQAGLKGIDRQRNVAVDSMLDDFSIRVASARFWPQTERLKAAVILAARHDADRSLYLEQADQALTSIFAYLEVPIRGGWRDRLPRTGVFVEEAIPASTFYHVVAAHLELQAFAATLGDPA